MRISTLTRLLEDQIIAAATKATNTSKSYAKRASHATAHALRAAATKLDS